MAWEQDKLTWAAEKGLKAAPCPEYHMAELRKGKIKEIFVM